MPGILLNYFFNSVITKIHKNTYLFNEILLSRLYILKLNTLLISDNEK